MTFKAFLGVIITTLLLIGGYYLILHYMGASVHDYSDALFFQAYEHKLRCFFFAIGALLAGLFAILSNFAVFAHEDEEYHDQDTFPFGAIPFFLLASLGLFAFALQCAVKEPVEILEEKEAALSAPVSTLAAAPDEPITLEPETTATETILEELAPEPEPVVVLPEPAVSILAGDQSWPYKYPLVRDGQHVHSSVDDRFLTTLFPMKDPTRAVTDLLCGKAWVAVAGASSQEGPALRNKQRARLRAELAVERALQWLEQAPEGCSAPVIIGVDLGQHAPAENDDGLSTRATAYQREVLFVSRRTVDREESPLTPEEAFDELNAYLTSPSGVRSLLGARTYHNIPAPFMLAGR